MKINVKIRVQHRIKTVEETNWTSVEAMFGETSKPDEELYLCSRIPKMPAVALKQAFIALFHAFHLFMITKKNKPCLVINMGGEIVGNLGNIVYVNAILVTSPTFQCPLP